MKINVRQKTEETQY